MFFFSGPYVFGITVGTYLISKEIFILEHEYYNGLSMLVIFVAGIKLLGPKVAQFLDKEIDKYNGELDENRNTEITEYENLITHEKQEQHNLDGQKMILEIKKENIKMQLEATYRERLAQVYQEV